MIALFLNHCTLLSFSVILSASLWCFSPLYTYDTSRDVISRERARLLLPFFCELFVMFLSSFSQLVTVLGL